jgi:hypothetical protein
MSLMAVWKLFPQREAEKAKSGHQEVYQYDDLPEKFRAQVVHIWLEAFGLWEDDRYNLGPSRHSPSNEWWEEIYSIFLRELGGFELVKHAGLNPMRQCNEYFRTAPVSEALGLIELTFHFIDTKVREYRWRNRDYLEPWDVDEAIKELNHRFRQHGIGYQLENGLITRVDSGYVHAEAVKPAIHVLNGAGAAFSGPLDEFLEAHRHFRAGNHKEAIAGAAKAFESTMKAICVARKWAFDPSSTASKLVDIEFANGLVPSYLQDHVAALRKVLEAGVPTVRNKLAGHGQGPMPVQVPEHYAAYVLHMTASNIVFLIESFKALK